MRVVAASGAPVCGAAMAQGIRGTGLDTNFPTHVGQNREMSKSTSEKRTKSSCKKQKLEECDGRLKIFFQDGGLMAQEGLWIFI